MSTLQKLTLLLVVLTLTAIILWGFGITIYGGAYIFSWLTDPIMPPPPDRILDVAVRTFFLGTMWIPIAVTVLVKIIRSRVRQGQLLSRVHWFWDPVCAFIVVVSVVAVALPDGWSQYIVNYKSESAECAVHMMLKQPDVVPIFYGLHRIDQSEAEARRERFPNSICFVYGGCVGGIARYARVDYCPECREQEQQWYQSKGQRWFSAQ